MSNNIVKQSQLKEIIDHSWTKTKERYDNAFVDAEIPTAEKKIKFTKANNTIKDVSLEKYARLQDRNEFKQDVSVDNAGSVSNLNIGRINGNTSNNRVLGYRGTTSKSFVDGYVDHLIIYMSSELTEATQIQTKVWAITKGTTTREDRHLKLVHNGANFPVETFDENGTPRKCIKVPIGEKFTNETYFMVKCPNHELQVCNNIDTKYDADVINMSVEPATTGEINFTSNNTNNTAIIHLVGRESIKSLSEKIDKVNADGGLYVKKEEVSTTSVANKVVRLGADGKLDKGMLPSIAINDYFTVSTFNDVQLRTITYENGDIVVATDTSKRYLCINKGTSNATTEFIELNSKDGIITSINGYRPGADGNIVVTATQNGTGITMTFGSTGGTPVTVATYMTDQEVTEIKNLFV